MEKLRLVKSFSELRVGQIVVATNCLSCGKAKCRTMLIKFVKDQYYSDGITLSFGDIFESYPKCKDIRRVVVTAQVVAEGRLWVVEDGLEDIEAVSRDIREIQKEVKDLANEVEELEKYLK